MDSRIQEAQDRMEREETRKILIKLMESQGWSKCQALWARLLTLKEGVKAAALRQDKGSDARYIQGFIDGLKEAEREVIKNTTRPKDEGPNY